MNCSPLLGENYCLLFCFFYEVPGIDRPPLLRHDIWKGAGNRKLTQSDMDEEDMIVNKWIINVKYGA